MLAVVTKNFGFVYSFFPCFLPLPSGATISTPTISTPSFLMFPRFPLPRFQSARFAIGFGLCHWWRWFRLFDKDALLT